MRKVIVRTGSDCISSLLTKCEIDFYSDKGKNQFISTRKENDTYYDWVFTGEINPALDWILDKLEGATVVSNYIEYCRADMSRPHFILYRNGVHKEDLLTEFSEYFADGIRDLNNEAGNTETFDWFTGSGFYFNEDLKDIFKNGGAIVLINESL